MRLVGSVCLCVLQSLSLTVKSLDQETSLLRVMRLLERIFDYCHYVHLSVCMSGTGVHCDHTVHFSTDVSLLLDSPMFWTS